MAEHNIISVSGGKDSTALLLLAIERGAENLQAVFCDTGNEHQITYDYVKYLNDEVFPITTIRPNFDEQILHKCEVIRTKWVKEGMDPIEAELIVSRLKPSGNPFLDLCMWKGRFPSTMARFCSEELKKLPSEKFIDSLMEDGDDVQNWHGVRADESAARRHLNAHELKRTHASGGEFWIYRPILAWAAEDCFAMHKKHNVKHNPLYEAGMGRVGCMPCIHARKDEVLEISKRFPEEIERIAEWEKIVGSVAKRGFSTFMAVVDDGSRGTAQGMYERGSITKVVEWSKTGRGGKTFDMIRSMNDGPICSSVYGLCE